MKIRFSIGYLAAIVLFATSRTTPATAAAFQLVSAIGDDQPSPAGGGGDSWAPIISPDGRFVLFASAANNLVAKTNGNPIPALVLPRLNVYLRDRTNGTTTLVSANLAGTGGGNGDSVPSDLSADGRYALFESSASDLITGDTNGATDIFLRDLASGTTRLISTNDSGGVGNGVSRNAVITPDGRYVAFVSAATNLVAGDTNRIPDVFVRDLQAGTTVLASPGAVSTNASVPIGGSESPDISADGRYVAFLSTATNLVPGVTQVGEVYVRDLAAGTTTWASTNARSMLGAQNAISYNLAISTNGNFVAFETSTNPPSSSAARGIILRYSLLTGLTDLVNTNANVISGPYEEIHNLAMTPDGRFVAFVGNTNGTSGTTTCIYLWDAQTGASTLASGNLSNQVPAGSICDWPAIDASGRYVAFLSSSTNMVTNVLAGEYHLYVRDMQTASTKLVAADTNGAASPISAMTLPSLSDDGRFVAFESQDAGLLASDRNRDYDVFVRDLATPPLELVSAHDPAFPSSSPNGPSSLSIFSPSANGRLMAFASEADNIVSNDTNGCRDIFVRDRGAGVNLLVSVATNGVAGDSISTDPAINADGRLVAFASSAGNLVGGDTNKAQDIFVRDLQAHTTTLVSISTNGTTGNGASSSPAISSDGKYVLFRSRANNLAVGISGASENLYLRNLLSGTTYSLTTAGIVSSAMAADGRFVAFVASDNRLYVWDSQAASRIYTNSPGAGTGFGALAFRPDDRWLAFATNGQLQVVDFVARANMLATPGYLGPRAGLQFSADGRFLTYAASSTPTGTNQVYLYDFQNQASSLVSRDPITQSGAISNSDWPVISADGRFIAYRSAATNLVPGDTNDVPDIFLYDRSTATTALLSAGRFGSVAADNRSLIPVFSGDGRTLFFESWASDVAAKDYNHNADVFAFRLLYASISPPAAPGQGPRITWPANPGTTYHVQYKNALSDPAWQIVSGTVSITDDTGSLTDLAPAAGQRFYRVVEL